MSIPTSCEWGITRCRHSVEIAGEGASKCIVCRLSPENRSTQLSLHWTPLPQFKSQPHPLIKQEKLTKQRQNQASRHQERISKDKSKQRVLRKAVKAEKDTEKAIIASTKNSGRSNCDGDHNLFSFITLDTKLQTTNVNPVVKLSELAKVNEDAKRAGNQIGGLVLRNKFGVGVIVFREEDIVKVIGESRCNESKT